MIIIIKKEVQINQMPVLQNMLIKKAWSPGPPPELRGVHGPALELQTKVPEDYAKFTITDKKASNRAFTGAFV